MLYLLGRTPYAVPDLAAVAALVVIAVAAIDGTAPALASGIILVAYGAYAYSSPGSFPVYSGPNLIRLVSLLSITLASGFLVGAVRARVNQLRSQRRAQDRLTADALNSKSEFMNAAAHELRTPLTVLAGYVSMLQDGTFGPPPESWRDPIHVVERKTRELVVLVDEMLLSARIVAGTVPAASERIDVRESVRQAVARAEPRVTLVQATLTYEVPSLPVLVAIDPDHLARIVDNLINNALTYSDTRPWVKVTVAGDREARVLVRDRGWGIPEDMRQRIFELFVRHAEPTHKPKQGIGLGLAISRDLAERYGGSLDLLWTQPGRGSTFVLRLPSVANSST